MKDDADPERTGGPGEGHRRARRPDRADPALEPPRRRARPRAPEESTCSRSPPRKAPATSIAPSPARPVVVTGDRGLLQRTGAQPARQRRAARRAAGRGRGGTSRAARPSSGSPIMVPASPYRTASASSRPSIARPGRKRSGRRPRPRPRPPDRAPARRRCRLGRRCQTGREERPSGCQRWIDDRLQQTRDAEAPAPRAPAMWSVPSATTRRCLRKQCRDSHPAETALRFWGRTAVKGLRHARRFVHALACLHDRPGLHGSHGGASGFRVRSGTPSIRPCPSTAPARSPQREAPFR